MLEFFAKILAPLLEVIFKGLRVIMVEDTGVVSAYAIALILATIIFKLLLLPLMLKQTKSMKEMQELQPKIQELQNKYKNDKEKLNMETMKLYQEHKVNPMGGCLPLLIQMPIIMGFYRLLQTPATYLFKDGSFDFDTINKSFFWVKDIGFAAGHVFKEGVYAGMVNGINLEFGTALPLIGTSFAVPIMAILAAIITYYQSKTMNTSAPANAQAAQTQKTMTIMMPFMILMIGVSLPEGLSLYWVVGGLFTIVQNYFVYKPIRKTKEE